MQVLFRKDCNLPHDRKRTSLNALIEVARHDSTANNKDKPDPRLNQQIKAIRQLEIRLRLCQKKLNAYNAMQDASYK